jgi:hypothetical protein
MRDFYAWVLGVTISDEDLEREICILSAGSKRPAYPEKESVMSKKRKKSKQQKPSFKAPAALNVTRAHQPSKKTQPNLNTSKVTSASERKPPFPPSSILAKDLQKPIPTPPV